jgi:hypothetical protein
MMMSGFQRYAQTVPKRSIIASIAIDTSCSNIIEISTNTRTLASALSTDLDRREGGQ